MEVLKLSRADVSAAETLLAHARQLAQSGDHTASAQVARRAAALASTLEDRYLAMRRARQSAAAALLRMREFGLPAPQLEAAIAEARNRAAGTAVENGVAVPNYLEARQVLERATATARGTIDHLEAAGAAIFAAQVAIDALREAEGDIDDRLFYEMLVRPAEAAFERATETLAMFRASDAIATAKAAEAMAQRSQADCAEARSARAAAERLLAEMRSEGAIALAADQLFEEGVGLLAKCKIHEAKETLIRSLREAARVADEFRRARSAISETRAKILPGEIGEEAVHALRDADRALREGGYQRALELVNESTAAMARRASIREGLRGELREMRAKVEQLKAAKAGYARDIEEVLVRAEQEFTLGHFGTCSEDLRVANLLISPRALEAPAAPRAAAPLPVAPDTGK